MRKIGFIASEAWKFFLFFILISAILIFIKNYFETERLISNFLIIISVLLAFCAFFSLYFFRNPERKIFIDKNRIYSPADGKIVGITDIKDEFVGNEAKKISIFMNIFNVHINRVPLNAEVINITYSTGKFMNAGKDEASFKNERNRIELEGDIKVTVTQVAGLIARRIKCFLKKNESVLQGDYLGLIQFGSRLDVIIPTNVKVTVREGDKVKAGLSILGEILK
ncbi:MAG: phosphatidylserine decarboxylase family protein [Candidatus Muiribacteriota bacterium]